MKNVEIPSDPVEMALFRYVRLRHGDNATHPLDWDRFYRFVVVAHAHRRGWDADDVEARMVRYGLPKAKAEEMGEVYWHWSLRVASEDGVDQARRIRRLGTEGRTSAYLTGSKWVVDLTTLLRIAVALGASPVQRAQRDVCGQAVFPLPAGEVAARSERAGGKILSRKSPRSVFRGFHPRLFLLFPFGERAWRGHRLMMSAMDQGASAPPHR